MISDLSFLEEGKFTGIDDYVKEVAQKVITSEQPSTALKEISEFVTSLKSREHTEGDFRKRTASEILRSGYSTGCSDTALAFIVLARYAGIPTRYVETVQEDWIDGKTAFYPIEGHVFVDVLVEGRWLAYEPISGFTPEGKYLLKRNNSKVYAEVGKGLDFSEVYPLENGEYGKSPINFQNIEIIKKFRKEHDSGLKQILQSSRSVLSISHKMDVDGICSAALVKTAFPNSILTFSNHDRVTMSHTLESVKNMMKKERFDLAIISDLSLDDSTAGIMEAVLKTLAENGCKSVFLDHHQITEQNKAMLSTNTAFEVSGWDANNCGSTLVYEYIFRNKSGENRNAHKLAILGTITDFGLFNEQELDSTPISSLIEAIMYVGIAAKDISESDAMLNKIVDALVAPESLDLSKIPYIKELSDLYMKEIESRSKKMLQDSSYLDLGDIKASIGTILDTDKELDSSTVCTLLKEKYPDSNLQIYIKKTGVRMRSQGVDTLPLARDFGGNGHPGASGFDIDFKEFNHLETGEDLNNFVEHLIDRINYLYKSKKDTSE